MEDTKNRKKQPKARTETMRPEGEKVPAHAHLIRIADQEARRRAITVLGQARASYCGFTDYRFLVTNEHLDVLKREAIPFEFES